MKRKEIPICAATWVNLENIMRNKGSHTQRLVNDPISVKYPDNVNLEVRRQVEGCRSSG